MRFSWQMNEIEPRNILVVGPSWVGDMVMCQSLFMVLKRRYPAASLHVLAPRWSLPILERMPEVDQALPMPFRHGELRINDRWRFAQGLRGMDMAIVIPNSFEIPVRIGWTGEFRYGLLTDCRRLVAEQFPRMVQRLVALGLPVSEQAPDHTPFPALRIDMASRERTASEFRLQDHDRWLAFCPGAEFGAAKQWPADRFAELASAAMADGWRILLIGSANDKTIATGIIEKLTPVERTLCHDLTGRTTLVQAVDLLYLATAVISNDSGLMHVAAALGKPVVAIYGSTSPDFTPPLADRVKLLFTDIACRPCFQRQCPLGHLRCLTELRADGVYQQLNDLLAQ